ncbi:MAG: hypothetical protein ACKVS6_09155 [Planctomycetota bacterium]
MFTSLLSLRSLLLAAGLSAIAFSQDSKPAEVNNPVATKPNPEAAAAALKKAAAAANVKEARESEIVVSLAVGAGINQARGAITIAADGSRTSIRVKADNDAIDKIDAKSIFDGKDLWIQDRGMTMKGTVEEIELLMRLNPQLAMFLGAPARVIAGYQKWYQFDRVENIEKDGKKYVAVSGNMMKEKRKLIVQKFTRDLCSTAKLYFNQSDSSLAGVELLNKSGAMSSGYFYTEWKKLEKAGDSLFSYIPPLGANIITPQDLMNQSIGNAVAEPDDDTPASKPAEK